MQLYPAIDLKDGNCVRLTQGLFEQAKIYSHTPADMAKEWENQGATFLHLVDLDGALAGRSVNEPAIRSILKAVSIPVQIGGGIRSRDGVASMLDLGVKRVLIGTKAAKNPEFIGEVVEEFGTDCIVAGIDAKDGKVAIEGWEKLSCLSALDLCKKMKDFGVQHIVYTDISRDGMLTGPNVPATKELTRETGLDIIASGGVSSMEDLRRLYEEGIKGAIIGKALYEKRIDLLEAIRCFETEGKG